MKKILKLMCICFFLFMASCQDDEEITFDKTYLYSTGGKWKSGTLYEVYKSNGDGHTWDTKDDITEDEAQRFTWTLSGDDLLQIHIMEIGANVPKTYTVTVLNSTTLTYEDYTGKRFSFQKVSQ